ncbi:MAG: hypothetical protein LBI44_01900 [Oscillospiraceae bacterium]|nr:hypothetical protein [Oscillospiraceae bacterium]
MRFCDKLNLLMQITRMSGASLSRGTGVDPSLVSRWRSGERLPTKRGHAAGSIGAYMAGVELLPADRELLTRTVGFSGLSDGDLAQAITVWLQSDDIVLLKNTDKTRADTPPAPAADTARGMGNASELVGTMARLLGSPPPPDTGPVNVWPYVQTGQPAEHSVFLGEKGKRQAVFGFLHAVQSSARPQDIFILINRSMRWIKDDPTFESLWGRSLASLLQRGHRVHIAVGKEYLSESLDTWLALPLFAYSSCRVYAVAESPADMLIVARGYAAVLGYDVGQAEEMTLLFRGVMDTSLFDAVFHSRLKEGEPVLFSCDTRSVYCERRLQTEEREGAYYIMKNTLSPMFVPHEVLLRALERAGVSDKRAVLEYNAARRELFERCVAYHLWVEILPRNLLRSLSAGSLTVGGGELAIERDLVLEGGDTASVLRVVTDLMRRYANFHLVWPEPADFPIQIYLKSAVGAYFSLPEHTPGRPAAVFTGRPDGLRLLEDWFTSHTYDRDKAISALTEALTDIHRK